MKAKQASSCCGCTGHKKVKDGSLQNVFGGRDFMPEDEAQKYRDQGYKVYWEPDPNRPGMDRQMFDDGRGPQHIGLRPHVNAK